MLIGSDLMDIGARFLLESENHDLVPALQMSVMARLMVTRGLLRRLGRPEMRHKWCGNHNKYRGAFSGLSRTSHGLRSAYTQEERTGRW